MSENINKNTKKVTTKNTKNVQKRNKTSEWTTKGTVICNKLHLRKEATKESESLKILDYGEKLSINENKSTDDFYYVRLKNNKKGYCMRKFVSTI